MKKFIIFGLFGLFLSGGATGADIQSCVFGGGVKGPTISYVAEISSDAYTWVGRLQACIGAACKTFDSVFTCYNDTGAANCKCKMWLPLESDWVDVSGTASATCIGRIARGGQYSTIINNGF